MVQFEADKEIAQECAVVWNKLRDASFLVECIPDAHVEGQPTRDQATCTVQPGFSFVRGSLDVKLHIAEFQEPTSVKVMITSKGIGSSSDVEANLALAPIATGTRIHWQILVTNLGGLLKMVPTGLIRGAAQKVIDDLWNNAQQKLA